MAKIYPKTSSSSSPSSSSCFMTSSREAFTVWMKSLVFNGNGCTVFDSNGDVVYRIDNYDNKSRNEVCLMDLRGKILVTIIQKKFSVSRFWEGYRGNDLELEEKKPWFHVRSPCRILKGDSACEVVIVGDQDNKHRQDCYKIEGSTGKPTSFKIINKLRGVLVAEVKQKESSSGVALGEDVMTLVVEPNVDHSLIMSLVVIYSLIHHKM